MKNQVLKHILLGCGAILVLGQSVAMASPVYLSRADLVRGKSGWSKSSNVDVTEFLAAAEGVANEAADVPAASTGESTPVAFTSRARFVPSEVLKSDRNKPSSIKDAKYIGQSVEVVPEPASVVVWSVIGCCMVAGTRFRRGAK
jgi:hypothetical protein